jgi:probable rRNA maturation factor
MQAIRRPPGEQDRLLPSPVIQIEIANDWTEWPIDETRLRAAIATILADAAISRATISVAIVDDPTIHDLNARFLQHDEPTDVLSFVLERDAASLEGEVIVSAQTAATTARRLGWSAEDELLLYVIHGSLHLVGYDDLDPESRAEMRRRERYHLARFGLEARYEES